MGYIKTEEAIEELYRYAFVTKDIIEKNIRELPSIDIVFCKECKWRKEDDSCDLNCRIEYLDGTETDMWFYVKDDDYCSYGERKSDE